MLNSRFCEILRIYCFFGVKWKVLSWFLYDLSFIYVWFLVPEFTSYAPSVCKEKDLMKIHNPGKFYQCSIYGCQVINFQSF